MSVVTIGVLTQGPATGAVRRRDQHLVQSTLRRALPTQRSRSRSSEAPGRAILMDPRAGRGEHPVEHGGELGVHGSGSKNFEAVSVDPRGSHQEITVCLGT